MDQSINSAVQKALDLLKAGNKTGAYTILVSVLEENSEVPEAWYLLAFTIADTEQKLDCFRQVLRIDPTNQAAQKQMDKLLSPPPTPTPRVDAFHPSPFDEPKPAAPAPKPEPAPYFSPTPQAEPVSTPRKRPAPTKQSIPWLWIGFGAFILLIIIGIPLVYISSGMQTNSKVNALFAERKCDDVVQYKSFSNSFPPVLFSSIYTVYRQVAECQAKKDLDYALKTQDWPTAYNVIQRYLGGYPTGAFATEMTEQANTVLTSWANNLIAQKDYKTAIEKLELLQRSYSTASTAANVQATIMNHYLFWGKDRFDEKDFTGAEAALKVVSQSDKASPEQVKQANQGLATVYIEWGKHDIEEGKIEQGLQRYDIAQSIAPDMTDYVLLKSHAGLIRAEALANGGDFDQALATIKNMLERASSDQEKADILAQEAKVLEAYSHSEDKQAQEMMSSAAIAMCGGQAPTLPIFGTDPNVALFAFVSHLSLQIPDGWGPFRPSELRYSVCIEHVKTRIQTCGPYRSYYRIYRNRYTWNVKLYDMTTGQVIQTKQFTGTTPKACQWSTSYYGGSQIIEFSGEMPGTEPVLEWLKQLGLHE